MDDLSVDNNTLCVCKKHLGVGLELFRSAALWILHIYLCACYFGRMIFY